MRKGRAYNLLSFFVETCQVTTQLDSYSIEGTNSFETAHWKHKTLVGRAELSLWLMVGAWVFFGNPGHRQAFIS